MTLTVDFYELDQAANDVKAGSLYLWGNEVCADDDKLKFVTRTAILVHEQLIDPAKEPERFMRSLHLVYHSPYFRAMKAK